MTTGTDTTVVDDREIPTIDPSRIPQLVDNKRDWRGELFYDTNWVENFGGTAAEYEGSGFQASQCGNSAAT